MEGISDIKIVGIDPTRPPLIRKEPYIDLYFQLSHEVPKDWSDDFNDLTSKQGIPAKISGVERLFIETWVRSPDDVVERLEDLKRYVTECTESYIAKVQLRKSHQDGANSAQGEELGEQGRLNKIIAGLTYE